MRRGSLVSRAAAVALLALVLALAYVVVGIPLQRAYVGVLDEIGDRRLALARLQDAGERAETIARSLRQAEGGAEALLLNAASDSAAAATMQNRLQALLQENGAQLSSLEALGGDVVEGHRAVRLRVQFATDTEGLRRILHALENGRPVTVLDNLSVNARSSRSVGVVRPLDVRLEITSFRSAT